MDTIEWLIEETGDTGPFGPIYRQFFAKPKEAVKTSWVNHARPGFLPPLKRKTVSSTIRWTLARPLRANGMTQLLRRTLFLNTNIINNPESQTNLLQQKKISPGNHFSRPAKALRVRGDKEGQGGSGGAETKWLRSNRRLPEALHPPQPEAAGCHFWRNIVIFGKSFSVSDCQNGKYWEKRSLSDERSAILAAIINCCVVTIF